MYWPLVVQGWMETILPEIVAVVIAGVLAAGVVILAVLSVLGELRGAA